MKLALAVLIAVVMACELSAQVAQVALDADLEIKSIPGTACDISIRFRFGAPYRIPRAVARISVTPKARLVKGATVWRGVLPENGTRVLTARLRLRRSTEYLIEATLESLHTRTGHVVIGTQRTQMVRVGAHGIEPIP
jgi:hypothetical protein